MLLIDSVKANDKVTRQIFWWVLEKKHVFTRRKEATYLVSKLM